MILYEASSGVRPLEGENSAQLVMRLLSSGIMPIEQLVPDLPPELAALIGRMLARDVTRRPADLREVYALLCRLAGEDSVPFGPPTRVEPDDANPVFARARLDAPVRTDVNGLANARAGRLERRARAARSPEASDADRPAGARRPRCSGDPGARAASGGPSAPGAARALGSPTAARGARHGGAREHRARARDSLGRPHAPGGRRARCFGATCERSPPHSGGQQLTARSSA